MTISNESVAVSTPEILHAGFCQLERRTVKFLNHHHDLASYEYVHKPAAVVVLPYDARLDQIVMIEQFRIGCYIHDQQGWMLEMVAGIIDQNETPLQAAKRELLEETHLSCTAMLNLGNFLTSPGFSTERIYYYVAAIDATQVGEVGGLSSEHEYLTLRVISSKELITILDHNQTKIQCSVKNKLKQQRLTINDSADN